MEAAIAEGAAGGRVVGTTPQQLGVSSWSQTDPASIGQAIYIRAAIDLAGLTQTQAAEYARLAAPRPHVTDGGTHREMTVADLGDRRVMAAGYYAGSVAEEVLADMRAYKAQQEGPAGASGLVAATTLALPRLPGLAAARVELLPGAAALAGEAAALAAAPAAIAASTLVAPVLITRHLVEAARVEVPVTQMPPPAQLSEAAAQPASPPPTQPMPLPPLTPSYPDQRELTNRLGPPLTSPRTPPGIQTQTPPTTSGQVPVPPPIITPVMDDELRRLTTDPLMVRRYDPQPFTRPISFPSPTKVTVDMDEIASGHQVGGWRLAPGNNKSLFPEDWSAERIERAVREAYRTADTVLVTQGERLLLEGSASGWVIHLWYNKTDKLIETAYPNRADVGGGK